MPVIATRDTVAADTLRPCSRATTPRRCALTVETRRTTSTEGAAMKVLTALSSTVPVMFIRARFHGADAATTATTATTAIQPDAERQPRSPESWLGRFWWGRAGTPEEEAAQAEALAIKARNSSQGDW